MTRSIVMLGVLAVGMCAMSLMSAAQDPPAAGVPPVLNFTMRTLSGEETSLARYKGKVLLLVNVASKCGNTPQYKQLEELNRKYRDKGLEILGFPANEFGQQEPGSNEQIREFCTKTYGVTFDMFAKVVVKGEGICPLYQFLTDKSTNPQFPGPISWNFEKFLISRDGRIVNRFWPGTKPDAPEVVKAIEAELAATYELSFDKLKAGELPPGWKADTTNPRAELTEWKVVADDKAPSKPNVLSITKITDTSGGHFNLFWTKDTLMKDGTLEVKIRANAGEEDQGGGLIWRAVDAKNYYVARYNPLETNFRLYYVKDGRRVQIAAASRLDSKTGEWFTMKIVVSGEKMEGYLNGKKLLEVSDKTLPDAGGVGFWSKADAASSFDDFAADPAKTGATTKPTSEE